MTIAGMDQAAQHTAETPNEREICLNIAFYPASGNSSHENYQEYPEESYWNMGRMIMKWLPGISHAQRV
jgi:hypothetical protein